MSDDLQAVADRIDALLTELRVISDDRTWAGIEDLVRQLTELYGEGLARFAALAGDEAVVRAAVDDVVAGLLLLHGLHPDGLAQRVQRTVDRLAPGLRKAGADLHVATVDGGAVRVQLTGPEGLRDGVAAALLDAAPDAASIEVVVASPVRLGPTRGGVLA